uniref:Ionotropic glutamate receptor L-glutamate and glycine-binding domain-containing protein n=1 Tax=Trichuris muris TaxID=70415 RepID=A0A5S6QQK1_TRIMR
MKPECYNSTERNCDLGLELEIVTTISKVLNLNVEFVYTKESGCGKKLPHSRVWTGLLGMLQRNEIDITGNLCDVFYDRTQEFEVSMPVVEHEQAYLLRLPIAGSTSFIAAVPFSNAAWYTIGFFIIAFFLAAVLHEQAKYEHSGLCDAACRCAQHLESICFQYNHIPRFFHWLCFLTTVLALKMAYVNYIRSALMHPKPVLAPFTNIDELTDQLLKNKYRLMHYFQNPVDVMPSCLPSSCKRLLEALNLTGVHFVADSSPRNLLNELLTHDNLVLVKGKFFLQIYLKEFKQRSKFWLISDRQVSMKFTSFFWKKRFPHAKGFNSFLAAMGDASKLLGKKYVGLVRDTVHSEPFVHGNELQETSVSLSDMRGAFVHFGAFVTVGCFVLLLEKVSPTIETSNGYRNRAIRKQRSWRKILLRNCYCSHQTGCIHCQAYQ